MRVLRVTILSLTVLFGFACSPTKEMSQSDRDELTEMLANLINEDRDKFNEARDKLRKKDTEKREVRYKRAIEAYYSESENPEVRGWLSFNEPPNDIATRKCFSKLKEIRGRETTQTREIKEGSIRTIRMLNGRKFATIVMVSTDSFGRKSDHRMLLDVSNCDILLRRGFNHAIHISPESGQIAHSSISPERGDDALLFYSSKSIDPFKVYGHPARNGIKVIIKPNLIKASFSEGPLDKNCFFSVLDRGENAAGRDKLLDICPNSSKTLEPKSVEYFLFYFWFGKEKIEELKAKKAEDEDSNIFLIDERFNSAVRTIKEEYIYESRFGRSNSLVKSDIDLSAEHYVWFPYGWHQEAWKARP